MASSHPVGRAALRVGAVLGIALSLSACAGFSPDGGMSVVAEVAGRELKKDVVAIRTPEQAALARDAVAALLRRPLSADAAVPDRIVEQSWPAGGL